MTTNKKPANAAGSLTGWATRLNRAAAAAPKQDKAADPMALALCKRLMDQFVSAVGRKPLQGGVALEDAAEQAFVADHRINSRLSEEVSGLGDSPRIVPSFVVGVDLVVEQDRLALERFLKRLVHQHVGVAKVVAVADALVRLGLVAGDHLAEIEGRKLLQLLTKRASKADFLLDRSHQFNSPVGFNTSTMNPTNNIVNTINASSHANP